MPPCHSAHSSAQDQLYFFFCQCSMFEYISNNNTAAESMTRISSRLSGVQVSKAACTGLHVSSGLHKLVRVLRGPKLSKHINP